MITKARMMELAEAIHDNAEDGAYSTAEGLGTRLDVEPSALESLLEGMTLLVQLRVFSGGVLEIEELVHPVALACFHLGFVAGNEAYLGTVGS